MGSRRAVLEMASGAKMARVPKWRGYKNSPVLFSLGCGVVLPFRILVSQGSPLPALSAVASFSPLRLPLSSSSSWSLGCPLWFCAGLPRMENGPSTLPSTLPKQTIHQMRVTMRMTRTTTFLTMPKRKKKIARSLNVQQTMACSTK